MARTTFRVVAALACLAPGSPFRTSSVSPANRTSSAPLLTSKLAELCIDGTRVLANASCHNTLTAEKVERLLAELDGQIATAMSELETNDTLDSLFEDGQPSDQLPSALRDMKSRQEQLNDYHQPVAAVDGACERGPTATRLHGFVRSPEVSRLTRHLYKHSYAATRRAHSRRLRLVGVACLAMSEHQWQISVRMRVLALGLAVPASASAYWFVFEYSLEFKCAVLSLEVNLAGMQRNFVERSAKDMGADAIEVIRINFLRSIHTRPKYRRHVISVVVPPQGPGRHRKGRVQIIRERLVALSQSREGIGLNNSAPQVRNLGKLTHQIGGEQRRHGSA